MFQILFLVIAGLGLLAALGCVLARNLVHAGLFLVGYFFVVAAVFVMLEAEFLAAIQVLVYIGAVAIILMFGIMLTRNVQGDDTTIVVGPWRVPAMLAGVLLLAVLVFGINNAVAPAGQAAWTGRAERPPITDDPANPPGTAVRREAINNMGRMVGLELMKRYAVAFEVAGLLLTAALVGAIALAHRDEEEPVVPSASGEGARRAEPAGPEAGLAASGGRTSP
ncbi:NADH-quinone oxidoreductase subunit J [Aquisphaera giovannonii]|uniref:NADH-quinone oxidoreductase subunit J n=1 Tax=Aquisphaera giovannonii TaxID=406548 RepID=A0A5B9VYP0_9BACT|nr:NADH-quinone oxidoreductase subunit J [Aquisphaera giovannonii]QEH33422.1 NADH-quinone oxidoreductase subunit J [Aquisphaera giovannonii]